MTFLLSGITIILLPPRWVHRMILFVILLVWLAALLEPPSVYRNLETGFVIAVVIIVLFWLVAGAGSLIRLAITAYFAARRDARPLVSISRPVLKYVDTAILALAGLVFAGQTAYFLAFALSGLPWGRAVHIGMAAVTALLAVAFLIKARLPFKGFGVIFFGTLSAIATWGVSMPDRMFANAEQLAQGHPYCISQGMAQRSISHRDDALLLTMHKNRIERARLIVQSPEGLTSFHWSHYFQEFKKTPESRLNPSHSHDYRFFCTPQVDFAKQLP